MRADMSGVGVRMVLGIGAMVVVAAGCPGEKRTKRADSVRAAVPVDTAPTDLSKVATSLPPAAPDTFKGPAHKVARKAPPPIPPAPAALVAAVDRERSFSRFCYQEFGQKVDPTLKGGVAMVVSVGSGGITGAKVASHTWSSKAGSGVNQCLDQKAATAWKLAPGAVKAGQYVVRMTFTGR